MPCGCRPPAQAVEEVVLEYDLQEPGDRRDSGRSCVRPPLHTGCRIPKTAQRLTDEVSRPDTQTLDYVYGDEGGRIGPQPLHDAPPLVGGELYLGLLHAPEFLLGFARSGPT